MKKVKKRVSAKPIPKKRPGSVPRDPSGRQKSSTVFLCPAEKQFLLDEFGSVSGGLRRILVRIMAEAEAKKQR